MRIIPQQEEAKNEFNRSSEAKNKTLKYDPCHENLTSLVDSQQQCIHEYTVSSVVVVVA